MVKTERETDVSEALLFFFVAFFNNVTAMGVVNNCKCMHWCNYTCEKRDKKKISTRLTYSKYINVVCKLSRRVCI